jgi:hypothetical protein
MGGRVRRMAGVAALAVAGMTLALAGPGTAGAQPDDQKIDTDIPYRCDRPDGTWHVVLRVTASFPANGKVGEPVKPSDVALALSVPPEAFTSLTGAVSATSAIKLETGIVQGDKTASATWGATTDQPVVLAADESTVFTATTEPEPVTAGAAGELSISAGGLVATLTGWTADGAATEPPNVELTCVPESDAALAVVPVAEDKSHEMPNPEIKVGTREGAAPPLAAAGTPPPECHKIDPPEGVTNYQSYCANLTGYANVAKLNTSVLQPAGLINISAGSFVARCDGVAGKFCSKNTVLPNLDGEPKLPPAPGSFYIFGIIPATGTMQLTQLGIGNVDIWFQGTAGLATARLKVTARLFDTEVNGVPLDVGPNCHTETPIDVVLTATPATYSITNGGVLSGTITIPPFTGCGVTEDLDPVVTGIVSGPNNFVKMTQSKVCSLGNGVNCPPEVPIPKR